MTHWLQREHPQICFLCLFKVIQIIKLFPFSVSICKELGSHYTHIGHRENYPPKLLFNFSLKFGFHHPISLGIENGNLFQYSCLENPTDIEDWWATVPNNQLLYPIIWDSPQLLHCSVNLCHRPALEPLFHIFLCISIIQPYWYSLSSCSILILISSPRAGCFLSSEPSMILFKSI